jgi:outer membrane protein OmpA-like peptidoglycan-associated protein
MLLPHLLSRLALAQGFDGSGVPAPPDSASLHDGLLGWGAQFPGAPSVELTGWAADEPLVRRVTDGPTVTDRPVVDDLYGLSLGGVVPVSQRVAIAARAPVWLGSGGTAGGGLAAGDVVLSAPIRVTTQDGPRLVLVPSVRAPTGPDARYLGDPGVGGSFVASGGLRGGPFGATLDLGLAAGVPTGIPDWPGEVSGSWVADVSAAPLEQLALHLELAGRAPLGRSVPGVPTEVMASFRVRPLDRFLLTGGVGTGVVRGVGAAALRMGVGARVAFGHDAVEAPPVVPPPASVLRVVDERGWPVIGAVVTGGTLRGETDAEGNAHLPPRADRVGLLQVEAPGFQPAEVLTVDGETSWEVHLRRRPVPVTASVVGPQGTLPDVFVDVESAGGDELSAHGPVTVDGGGLHHVELPTGTWTLHLGAPGMAEQLRTVVIDPSRTEPIRVDAVLTPLEDPAVVLAVSVVDGYGLPVEDAVVALGERDLGTTATGGDVVVDGLTAGEVAVVVRSSRIAERTVVPATLVVGRNEVRAVLDWPAGSVLVRVTDTKGRPIDAGVTFSGAAQLPSRNVGSDGEELFVLRPGEWTLRTRADAFAPQSRTLRVPERKGELLRVDVALLPAEGGRLALDLGVLDVDGGVVPGVQLLVDGQPIGVPGTNGRVRLEGLSPGQKFLEARGELLVPTRSETELAAPLQREDLVIWYTPGVVDVQVRDPAGAPVDARVAFSGPSETPSGQTGGDGKLRTVLPPGAWQLATSHETLGLRVDDVTVVPDERRRHFLDLRMAPVEDETATVDLVVHDPEGAPVEAEVSVDGMSTGRTPGGRVRLEGLAPGPAILDIVAEGHLPDHQELELAEVQALDVTLPWAAGSLLVTVTGPDGPLDGARVGLAGATPVPSRESTGGQVSFSTSPGTWWVLASHPDYAVAEASVTLPEAPGLTRLALTLAAVEPDDAQLVLSVRDEAGMPLANVPVAIDGVAVGTTSAGGTFALVDRPQGKAVVTLTPGPGYGPVEVPVTLQKGEQDQNTVVVPFTETAVEVVVPGATPGTRLTAYGEDAVAREVTVGADGTAKLTLPPGRFTVVAEDQGRAGSTLVTVRPGAPTRAEVQLYETGTTVTGGLIRLTRPVLFDVASAEIRPDAAVVLDDVARRLVVDRTAALVEIQGHTSDEGGVAYNQQLSEARALAIRVALVERGVEPERLVSRGYGLSRPLTPQKDEEARSQNRRVELVILDSVELATPR